MWRGLLTIFLALSITGCLWNNVDLGGSINLGGFISTIVDLKIEGHIRLNNQITKKGSQDETDPKNDADSHSHNWECL